MISSSKRVIKRPDKSGSVSVEAYLPPTEQLISSHAVPQAPVFPRYTPDGMREDDLQLALKETASSMPSDEEDMEGLSEVSEEGNGDNRSQGPGSWREEEARILEEARREAQQILEDAARQADRERERAFEEGRQEGYARGYDEGYQKAEEEFRGEIREHLQEFEDDMRKALDAVDTARKNCLHTYLEELKDCAIAIGEKVIHISLRSSGEVIKQMIISATEKLKKTAWVKIYMDKYDYDMMMEADAGVIDELSHLSDNIKFIVMDKEDRGSCIIEMPEEIVDVSVNTQIENIKDILENVRI